MSPPLMARGDGTLTWFHETGASGAAGVGSRLSSGWCCFWLGSTPVPSKAAPAWPGVAAFTAEETADCLPLALRAGAGTVALGSSAFAEMSEMPVAKPVFGWAAVASSADCAVAAGRASEPLAKLACRAVRAGATGVIERPGPCSVAVADGVALPICPAPERTAPMGATGVATGTETGAVTTCASAGTSAPEAGTRSAADRREARSFEALCSISGTS